MFADMNQSTYNIIKNGIERDGVLIQTKDQRLLMCIFPIAEPEISDYIVQAVNEKLEREKLEREKPDRIDTAKIREHMQGLLNIIDKQLRK